MDKVDILIKIKQIAEHDGGAAPGMKKFYRLTGIGNSTWYGKYWTRWSDALKEAGLNPNPPSLPYDRTFLIEKMISYIRELNNFPTEAELRMKRCLDKTFPGAKRFRSHFGNKAELLETIINYCRNEQGYEDVTTVCRAVYRKAAPGEELFFDRPSGNSAYICMIKYKGLYKIGSRSTPLTEQMLSGHAAGIRIIHCYYANSEMLELNKWRNNFIQHHAENNWYSLPPVCVQEFKTKKGS